MSKTVTPPGGQPARLLFLLAGAVVLPVLGSPAAAQLLASAQPMQTLPGNAAPTVGLRQLLAQWEKQYKSTIAYDSDVVGNKRVTLSGEAGTLEDKLARALAQVGLSFKRLHPNNYVIISAGPSSAAQDITVSGRVVDNKGDGLPGVTVLAKGTTIGVSTGLNGEFTLKIPQGSTLVFSYVGFLTQEVLTTSGTTTYNVTLTNDNKQLDDVVVIGYGTVQRSELTGSVSSVSAQQIKDIPVNSAAEALTGRLAGVQLTSSEGTPGANVRIRVRGGGSITQDNSPLYVVDGIQIENALSVISPQDIASVDVLKDAASTAIYGARGANGVVIITTKNGIEGRTTVSYSGFAGVRRLAKKLDVLRPGEFIDLQYERAVRNSADLTTFRGAYGSRNFTGDTLAQARQSPFTDWQDEVFGRDAFQQTHNISVSGGGKGTVYSLSLTSNREQGIQLASDFDRKLLNFRLDNKATDKLRLGFNVRLNDQTINGAGTASGTLSTSSRLRNTIQYRPFTNNLGTGVVLDPTQPDEDYYLLSGGTSGLINPIVLANAEYRRDGQRLVNSSAYASYNFTKSLSLRSTAGIDYRTTRTEAFNSKVTGVARQNGNQPTASISTGTQFTFNNSNVLTYTFLSKSKHSFSVLLGQEVYQTLNNSLNISAFYLPTDIEPGKALANFNQAQAPPGFVQPSPTTNEDPNRILSGFSRVPVYRHDARGWLVEVCAGPACGSVPGRCGGLAVVEGKIHAAAYGRFGPEAAPELRGGRQQPHWQQPVSRNLFDQRRRVRPR
jgi:TonB-linked SusC/RagA family outer membrane protein